MKFAARIASTLTLAMTAAMCLAQTAPVLTDAAGRNVIGRFLDGAAGNRDGAVVVAVGKENVILRLTTDFMNPSSTGLTWSRAQIWYTAPGCSGTAYLGGGVVYGGRRLGDAALQGNAWYAFISSATPVSVSQTQTFMSSLGLDGQCFDFQGPLEQNGSFIPVQTTFLLDKLGVPPFYVR